MQLRDEEKIDVNMITIVSHFYTLCIWVIFTHIGFTSQWMGVWAVNEEVVFHPEAMYLNDGIRDFRIQGCMKVFPHMQVI